MFITICVNPVLDVIFGEPSERHESRQFFSSISVSGGGFGANTARALKCLGESPLCLLPSGGATGQLLLSCLRAEGFASFNVDSASATRIAVIQPSRRSPRMLVSPSPILSSKALEEVFDVALTTSGPSDVMLVGGSVSPANESLYFELLGRLAAERRCYCDIRTARVSDLVASRPFAVKLPAARGERRPSLESVVALQGVVGEGIHLAIKSIGHRKVLAATKEEVLYGYAPRVDAVNRFGAGDCLIAALAQRLSLGLDLSSALRQAMAAASASVLSRAPGLFEPEEAHALEDRIRIKALQGGKLRGVH